jgi:hypothetical protein
LTSDGASTNENIRRRLQWLAQEWKIPADQLPKITRTITKELRDFIQRYDVNCDWLLYGDLKGLRRMMYARKGIPTARQLSEKISSLPPDLKQIVVGKINRLLEKRVAEEPEPA